MLRKLLCYFGYHKFYSIEVEDGMLNGLPGYRGCSRLRCEHCNFISDTVTASFHFTIRS